MKCYFCQSDMTSTVENCFLCPNCPYETFMYNFDKNYVSHIFSIKKATYIASWKFSDNQLETFSLFKGTLILRLFEGIDKITPQNVVQKMKTYLPFI